MKKSILMIMLLTVLFLLCAGCENQETAQTEQSSDITNSSETTEEKQIDPMTVEAEKVIAELYQGAEARVTASEEKVSATVKVPGLDETAMPAQEAKTVPGDWQDTVETAKNACGALGEIAGAQSAQLIVTVTGESETIYLTVINGKVAYDVFEDGEKNSSGNTITRDVFDAIDLGMTQEEVFALVGSKGTVVSGTDGDTVGMVIYSWEGEGNAGASAEVTFEGGVVTSKNQSGLGGASQNGDMESGSDSSVIIGGVTTGEAIAIPVG